MQEKDALKEHVLLEKVDHEKNDIGTVWSAKCKYLKVKKVFLTTMH